MRNGLKAIRVRRELTQAAAAESMGLSRSGYVKIEDGKRKLSEQHIRAAMRVFDATEAEVLGTAAVRLSPGAPAPRDIRLTPEQAHALAQACLMFLEEATAHRRETHWLEALVKIARSQEAEGGVEALDTLRIKVRTLLSLGG